MPYYHYITISIVVGERRVHNDSVGIQCTQMHYHTLYHSFCSAHYGDRQHSSGTATFTRETASMLAFCSSYA